MLIDTHCHLDIEYFPQGPEEAIARAKAAGVQAFITIGVGLSKDALRAAVALAEKRNDVAATVGVHPHDAAQIEGPLRAEILALAAHPRVVAIGEIGLDFHYEHSPREKQQEVFCEFIHLAKKLHKPIVVHSRSAREETLAILKDECADEVGGVIHCFSEDRVFAKQALDLGFDLSFSGIVTFKNAVAIQDVAQWAPLDRILVETDSPYLAPVPLRGKPCEPAFVVHTAKKIAELRGIAYEELAVHTTQNAIRRFGDVFGRSQGEGLWPPAVGR